MRVKETVREAGGSRPRKQRGRGREAQPCAAPHTHVISVPRFPAEVVGQPPLLGHGLALVHLKLRLANDLLHRLVLAEGVLLHALGDLHVLQGQVRGALEAALQQCAQEKLGGGGREKEGRGCRGEGA